MRILVPYSFAFGDRSFPWGGLIDPKFDQKIPWLLGIRFLPPVDIPLIDVDEPGVLFEYGYSNLVGVCASISALELVAEQAALCPDVSFVEMGATFSMQTVGADTDTSAISLAATQSRYSSCGSFARVSVSVTQAGIGVDT